MYRGSRVAYGCYWSLQSYPVFSFVFLMFAPPVFSHPGDIATKTLIMIIALYLLRKPVTFAQMMHGDETAFNVIR